MNDEWKNVIGVFWNLHSVIRTQKDSVDHWKPIRTSLDGLARLFNVA